MYENDIFKKIKFKDEIINIIRGDHCEYLSNITANAIKKAGLLDLPHQTILRLGESCGLISDVSAIQNYFGDSKFRKEVLSQLKVQYKISKNVKIRTTLIPAGSGLYDQQSRWREFELLCSQLKSEHLLLFANPYGFALFPVIANQEKNGITLVRLEDMSFASTGAMMYYGFSTGEINKSYLIQPSLNILTQTLICYREFGPSVGCGEEWRERRISEELKIINHKSNIVEAVDKMIVNHEIGHHTYYLKEPLRSIFATLNINNSELYLPSFVDSTQLGAWERIKGNSGNLADTIFLIGDFLANICILSDKWDSEIVAVLRSFHWWLIRPISQSHRPRAVSWFLGLTEHNTLNVNLLFEVLTDVFGTARNRPQDISKTLFKWEEYFWNKLKKNGL